MVVLEAGGPDRHPWIHVPLGYGRTIADPRVNWMYETEPDPAMNNRRFFWPRGKVLGGSSSINGLLYVRGQAEDFDHWRQLGNDGWAYEDVLPYFRRSEGRIGAGDDALRGRDGPLTVCDIGHPNPLSEAYLQAATEPASRAIPTTTAARRRAWRISRPRRATAGAVRPRWRS